MKKQQNKYKVYHKIDNYQDFIDTIYSNLGAPVVEVNVTPEQVFNVVSHATQKYIEYDLESVCEQWWLHQITDEDVKNGYITIPADVLDIMSILGDSTGTISTSYGTASGYSPNSPCSGGDEPVPTTTAVNCGCREPYTFSENPTYMFFQNYWNYGSNYYAGNLNLFYYEISMQYLEIIKQLFQTKVEFAYRRRQRKLWLYSYGLKAGAFICLYGTKMLDPETEDSVWGSDWLLDYATAKVGVQWGINLMKYVGVTASGGLQVNAEGILNYWTNEVARLEEEHRAMYQEPPLIFIE